MSCSKSGENILNRTKSGKHTSKIHNLSHSGVCFFLTPDVLEAAIKDGDENERNKALHMIRISERLRAQRHMISRVSPKISPSLAGVVSGYVKRRIVYDMQHIADDNLLPGRPVRYENDKKAMEHAHCTNGNKEIDKCFNNTALVYDFYKEVFKRTSLDDNGMTLHSSVNFDDDLDNA